MRTVTVTGPSGGLLRAVREVLTGVDAAMLCVAFADIRGVQLLRRELDATKRSGSRLVVTTAFGATDPAALTLAHRTGTSVRLLNPGSGRTYHPKVYLGRRGNDLAALVGSANLTSGLAVNIEAASWLVGTLDDQPLRDLWEWAESIWDDPCTRPWEPAPEAVDQEALEPELFRLVSAAAMANPQFYTLGPTPRPNYVAEVTPAGLYVETERSRQRTGGPELVEPWMLNLAWEVLRSRGTLTNRELLNQLRVHRSSAVCAILARLPGVSAEGGRGIRLRWTAGDERSSV